MCRNIVIFIKHQILIKDKTLQRQISPTLVEIKGFHYTGGKGFKFSTNQQNQSQINVKYTCIKILKLEI